MAKTEGQAEKKRAAKVDKPAEKAKTARQTGKSSQPKKASEAKPEKSPRKTARSAAEKAQAAKTEIEKTEKTINTAKSANASGGKAAVGKPSKPAKHADGTEKPAEKKPAAAKKKPEKQTEVSNKTPQVMRLVEKNLDVVNPTILAGKSSIPRKLRGIEPLSRIMKREAEGIIDTDEEAVTYNLTALAIDDQAAEILRRFNACDCEICIDTLSGLAAESIPARFAKLKKSAVERRTPEVEELKEPLRRKVTSQMIRLVMQNKKRSYHD